MRVLLTNDDGIEAAGLQALRRALLDGRRDRAGGDRPGRQPLGDGAVDHDPPAAVGAGGRLRRRHGRLRHRRDAGRLRAAGQPRAGRGVRGRAGRVRHQPRLEPGRRHHLLGDGGGGARGDRARPARDRGLAAVERARARLQGRARRSTSRVAATFTARLVAELETVPLPVGHAAQHQRPGPAPERRRGGAARQARLPDELSLVDEDRRETAAVPDLRRRELRARRDRHRPGRGGAGQDRGHADPLRPDRPRGPVGAPALRPRAADRAGGGRGGRQP